LRGRVMRVDRSAFRRMSALGVEEVRTRVTVALVEGETVPIGLGDGYKIVGAFQLHESPDVIKVPLGALFRKGADWFVFRVVDGRAMQTKVELGPRNEREFVVVSGLSDYDLVVLFPANRIENASRISVR
jgi:HlyD family secretion protein